MSSNIPPEVPVVISLVSLLLTLASFIFTWKRTKKEHPLLKHEVLSCKHKVTENGKATDLEILFKLHNRGDRGTQLNRIEAWATDFKGLEHFTSRDLSKIDYLDAQDSTKEIRTSFTFSPHFQYRTKMRCRFRIHHTTGEYPFEHESEESEDYLVTVPFAEM